MKLINLKNNKPMKNLILVLTVILTVSCSTSKVLQSDCIIPERNEFETSLLNELLQYATTDNQCLCYDLLTNKLFMLNEDCQISYEFYLEILDEIVRNLDTKIDFIDDEYDICSVYNELMSYILHDSTNYEFLF